MVIHTTEGSAAERMAKEHGRKVDYKSAPAAAATTKKSSAKIASAVDETAGLDDTMSDLSAQITEMRNQELSAEDRETLSNVIGLMDDLNEGQVTMGKYIDYLEQKKAAEEAQEEEKSRRKAEAVAAGKSEQDIVNMYIILTNEKKLGKLHRSQDEFYETYEEDFAALSKAEVIKTRKDMLEEMEDDSLCSYYAESFKQRSVEDRFAVSTRNLNNVSTEPEIGVKADWAIENSKEWYQPAEYAEVRKLMDEDLADIRKQLDDQLKPLDEAWTKFSTAKDFLLIDVTNKASDGSDILSQHSNFQVVIGGQLVAVRLSSKGVLKMVTTVMNCFTWYWGVTVRDVWEAALQNEVSDEREGACNGSQLANQAIDQIRSKHPETKIAPSTTSTSSYSKPAASGYTAPASTAQHSTATNSTQQTSSQPAKKEGCYIATAVYGSYDAPQVMTLRRYRDETLRNTAFGRWFIRTYYRLSPPAAEKLKNAKHINKFIRSILDKWVEKLNRKQQ